MAREVVAVRLSAEECKRIHKLRDWARVKSRGQMIRLGILALERMPLEQLRTLAEELKSQEVANDPRRSRKAAVAGPPRPRRPKPKSKPGSPLLPG